MCLCLVTSVLSDFAIYGLQPTRLLCPWYSPGKNTGVGCHALLQGIFPTRGSNSSLLLPEQSTLARLASRDAGSGLPAPLHLP